MEANWWATEGFTKRPQAKILNEFVQSHGFIPIPDKKNTVKVLRFLHIERKLPLDIEPLKTVINIWTLPFNFDDVPFEKRKYKPSQGRNTNLQGELKAKKSKHCNAVISWQLDVVNDDSLKDLGRLLDAYISESPTSVISHSDHTIKNKPASSQIKVSEIPPVTQEEKALRLRQMLETAISEPIQTEEKRQVTQRRFQPFLRAALIEEKQSCEVTGVQTQEALIASHIKPWKDSTKEEKHDLENVLLLSAHFDNLFDRGLISFDDEGKILISPRLDADERARLNLTGEERLRTKPSEKKVGYLKFHRKMYGFE